MGLLDTMLQNDVERNAPQIKPWNSNGFINSMNQYLNLSNNIDDTQRQNSILNLIAQREKDGIPYDRLADEVAKYDPSMAMNLQNQAQKSITWNRQESEAELANYKKAMAGWLGGVVLRRANEAVQNGTAQWDLDYVVKVCNETAAVIYPYDPSGADALLKYSQGLTGKKASIDSKEANSRKTFMKDHEIDGTFNRTINNLGGLVVDPDKDPPGYANKTIRLEATKRLQRWKNKNPYGENNLEGRQLWSHMIDTLAQYASDKFDDSLSGKNVQETAKWIRTGLTDEEISNIPEFAKYAEPENDIVDGEETPIQSIEKITPKGNVVRKPTGSIAVPQKGEQKSGIAIPKDIVGYNQAGAKVYSSRKGALLGQAIAEAETLDDIKKLRDALDNSGSIKNDNNDLFSSLEKRIKDKEDEIKEVLQFARQNGVGEADLRKFKDLFGTRATTTIIRQWKNFHAFNGGYLSKNPGTAINNALLTMNPDYKPTDYDAKVTKVVDDPENDFTRWQGIIGSMDIPVLSKVMDYDMFSKALQATAGDVATTMRGAWEATIDGMTEEESKKAKELYTKMFKLDSNDWKILNGENYPVGEEYERQRKAYAKRNSKNTADLTNTSSTSSSDSSSAKTIKTLSNYDY